MNTVGRTYILKLNASGVGVIPQSDGRWSLWIGPTTAEAWQLALYSTPDTSSGLAFNANNPIAEVYREYVGSAIDGQHTIYGTASHTFIITETSLAP